jgi:selenide, water dikinase
MMQTAIIPVKQDLVLLGGGHSHLFVLRYFAMNPILSVRVTLITRDIETAYSGMLPGLIAGHYQFDEAHIDLQPLCRYANARLIHAKVEGIDSQAQTIQIENRPPISYNLLSINTGSTPAFGQSDDFDISQFAIKPVDRFLDMWNQVESRLRQGKLNQITVVGGGAGGVELILSLHYQINRLETENFPELTLVYQGDELLQSHNAVVRHRFNQVLRDKKIRLVNEFDAVRFEHGLLIDSNGKQLETETVIWATNATAPAWLENSGIKLDENGFIEVNEYLQSISHGNIFSAGDVASQQHHPRPRSGVFAVRQGIPLAKNLQRSLNKERLKPFKPQLKFLSLISTGSRTAVASQGNWVASGKWLWWIKNRIDHRFMKQFTKLPVMGDSAPELEDAMRCGGCGSKVASGLLQDVLERLSEQSSSSKHQNLSTDVEDAYVVPISTSGNLIQSVDYLRQFINDPYYFGQLAAIHAVSDLYAMGVEPSHVQAIASVPFGDPQKQSQDLYQLMSGALAALDKMDARLVGGHSLESHEFGLGFSVNALTDEPILWKKSGMRVGDKIILTKPLGSGVLFAADMRNQAKGRWIKSAVDEMLISNRDAMQVFRSVGINACTDVTGFGLAGHLSEMLDSSDVSVRLNLDTIPLFEGIEPLIQAGFQSSLFEQNKSPGSVNLTGVDEQDWRVNTLFDPQTCGGLLASVDATRADDCLVDLKQAGVTYASIIGEVIQSDNGNQIIAVASAAI